MRRVILLTASIVAVAYPAFAGPGGPSGPVTVDSTTFVPASSVMGTVGGVYSDTLPAVKSTTTAAYRMTPYRAEHVNLRDNAGDALGVSGNPLYITPVSSITIGAVSVTNSSFSVTGSTVHVDNTGFTVTNTPNVNVTNNPLPVSLTSTKVTGSTVTITNTGFAVTNTPSVSISNSPTVTANAGVGPFNVTGSTVSIQGTVTVGNQLTVNSLTQIKNGAGTPITAGWDSSGSSVPVHEIGTSNVNVTNNPLKVSASISGSSNTVQISGTVPASIVNVATVTLSASSPVNTTSVNVATVTLSGTPTVQTINVATVTFNGTAQPVTQSGSWSVNSTAVNVGTVSVSGTPSVAQSGTWNVGLSTGTNTVGNFGFALPTATSFSSSTINVSGAGDNLIVAGSVSKTVRVFRIFFVVSGVTTISIKDGVSGALLTGPMSFSTGGGFALDLAGDPWFVTSSGNGFVINQTGTSQISGRIYYQQS